MSWNIALVGKDVEDAKAKLAEKCEQDGHVPEAVKSALEGLIDALPESMEGHRSINVASYGHFNSGEHPGTSNLTIAVQHVADVADTSA